MYFLKNWPVALFVFYLCLVVPAAFACEARLDLASTSGFTFKGSLGDKDEYVQQVYSGDRMSFSTIVFPEKMKFSKKKAFQKTAQGMLTTVQNKTKNFKPSIKVLNESHLTKIDPRLAFLSYIKYGSDISVNVEASGVIKTKRCWAILRFTALAKDTKEVALNNFAALIRSTKMP